MIGEAERSLDRAGIEEVVLACFDPSLRGVTTKRLPVGVPAAATGVVAAVVEWVELLAGGLDGRVAAAAAVVAAGLDEEGIRVAAALGVGVGVAVA